MAKNAAISVRVDPALKAQVEEAARADGRTVSQYVERLLVLHLSSMSSPKTSDRPAARKSRST
jgi:Ribbon-helix-helix protein, copG family